MSFITVVKPDGNKFLFDWVEGFDWSQDFSKRIESQGELLFVDEQGRTHDHPRRKSSLARRE